MFWLRVRGTLSFSPYEVSQTLVLEGDLRQDPGRVCDKTCLEAQPGALPMEAVEAGSLNLPLRRGSGGGPGWCISAEPEAPGWRQGWGRAAYWRRAGEPW